MGFDLGRFENEVDEELICPICGGVLEDPVQASPCEHLFCRHCIETWLQESPTCPVDRESLGHPQLGTPPRILRNLLCRLLITCDNQRYGCPALLNFDALASHVRECEHNPNRATACPQGCGLQIPINILMDHNCVQSLRCALEEQQEKVKSLEERVTDHYRMLQQQERALREMKEALAGLMSGDGGSQSVDGSSSQAAVSTDELESWVRSLARAKVTRWGGMISTPDAVLQSAIRRSLLESGCAMAAVSGLIERAHEREWPRGLQSLEVRQNNRNQYERYICRRIPARQAVVILASENRHMPLELISEPALVIIFANGVE